MKRTVSLVALSLWALAAARDARSQDQGSLRGLVDVSALSSPFGNTPTLEVDIQGPLLKLVAEASREEDAELADLLLRLHAIQVRGFSLTRGTFRAAEREAERVAQRMKDEGWNPVVNLRDTNRYVDMFVLQNRATIEGMLLLVLDAETGETVFINIVGDIDPEEMGRIGSRFTNVPIEDAASH
jgi:hypothetical protein